MVITNPEDDWEEGVVCCKCFKADSKLLRADALVITQIFSVPNS